MAKDVKYIIRTRTPEAILNTGFILRSLLLTLFISLLLNSNSFAAQLNFAAVKDGYGQKIGEIILIPIYKKLGIDISITPMPAARAERSVVQGQKDGEVLRVYSYGEEHPSLIRVPTPIYQVETTPFIRMGCNAKVTKAEDLKHYRVAAVKGIRHTNDLEKKNIRIHKLNSLEQLMKFVSKGRAEIGLSDKNNGELALRRLGIENIKSGPVICRQNLYHYIHASKEDLVPKLDAIIRKMKQNGELKKLIKKAEEESSTIRVKRAGPDSIYCPN